VTASFRPGDHVYWWKRITRAVEYPYRAEVVTVGAKRITIAFDDPEGGPDRIFRHVAAASLQPVEMYYEKAGSQGPSMREPLATWGRFTRYLELGEDLWALCQVDVFENGNMLRYDRIHWVDGFGILASARINRNGKQGLWGHGEEIDTAEFDRIWTAARASPLWRHQQATAQMARLGVVPVWLTISRWHPSGTSRRT
jgi:hypothetical protein